MSETIQSRRPNWKTNSQLRLDIPTEKLEGIEHELGPNGIGTFAVKKALNPEQLAIMHSEIHDESRVQWSEAGEPFTNARGMYVEQNHLVHALKLSRGDQTLVDRAPRMKTLARNIQNLVQSLSGSFPNLEDWQADEMSLQRYYGQEVGLGFHKDNLRYIGLIAVMTLEGASDFIVRGGEGDEHVYPVSEGDLMLTRATDLYSSTGPTGKPLNLCPDHAVMNLKTPYRTSFIVRANSRPDDHNPGFRYANWRPDAITE